MEPENMKEWLAVAAKANVVLYDEASVPVAAARWARVAPDAVYVHSVEVRLDSRRRGWGKRLWGAILEQAGDGLRKVLGEQKNEAAVRLRAAVFENTVFYHRGVKVATPSCAARLARQTDRTFAVSFLYET
jgi:GNAT superfamily N-acetyltransferase